ncbi:hypothetical protein Ccrd_026675, partial [Cynara cardunculus var. scolymus]
MLSIFWVLDVYFASIFRMERALGCFCIDFCSHEDNCITRNLTMWLTRLGDDQRMHEFPDNYEVYVVMEGPITSIENMHVLDLGNMIKQYFGKSIHSYENGNKEGLPITEWNTLIPLIPVLRFKVV